MRGHRAQHKTDRIDWTGRDSVWCVLLEVQLGRSRRRYLKSCWFFFNGQKLFSSQICFFFRRSYIKQSVRQTRFHEEVFPEGKNTCNVLGSAFCYCKNCVSHPQVLSVRYKVIDTVAAHTDVRNHP